MKLELDQKDGVVGALKLIPKDTREALLLWDTEAAFRMRSEGLLLLVEEDHDAEMRVLTMVITRRKHIDKINQLIDERQAKNLPGIFGTWVMEAEKQGQFASYWKRMRGGL
jgi:hypothetical protein